MVPNASNCLHLQNDQTDNRIISVDSDGASILIHPQDLTKLFCYNTPNSNDPLLSQAHLDAIADYIN